MQKKSGIFEEWRHTSMWAEEEWAWTEEEVGMGRGGGGYG